MDINSIVSIVFSLIALILSIASLFYTFTNDKKESISNYRHHFFSEIINDEYLKSLSVLIVKIKSQKYEDNIFNDIHLNCLCYLKSLEILSIVDEDNYLKIKKALQSIDDSAVISIQKIHDNEPYDEKLNTIISNSVLLYKNLEEYFTGRK